MTAFETQLGPFDAPPKSKDAGPSTAELLLHDADVAQAGILNAKAAPMEHKEPKELNFAAAEDKNFWGTFGQKGDAAGQQAKDANFNHLTDHVNEAPARQLADSHPQSQSLDHQFSTAQHLDTSAKGPHLASSGTPLRHAA